MPTVAVLEIGVFKGLFDRLNNLNTEITSVLRDDKRMKNDKDELRLGGMYCHANEFGQPLLTILIGQVAFADVPRYKGFVEEKANRLGILRRSNTGHTLSRHSEDDRFGRFRGAVAGPYSNSAIRSFSGYPGSVDEIISAWNGVVENDYNAQWALGTLASVRNEYLDRLNHLFSKEFLEPYLQ